MKLVLPPLYFSLPREQLLKHPRICSVGSGTLKKYRGGGTAVNFFLKCGSGNGSGKSTAVLPR